MGAETVVNASAGKRGAKRARVLISAKLQTPHGELDARLRDISRKGALVECGTQLPAGTEVVFMRGQTIIPARVAWSGGNRVGLEFHFPIDEHEVMIQLKKPASGGEQPRFRRPALGASLTRQEERMARAWGVAVGINIAD